MIIFQYFEGCPNAFDTMNNFKMALKELDISDEDFEIVEVPDLHSAEMNKFQGSPTILFNGVDIYTDKSPEGYNYTCRIFDFGGNRTGIINREFIITKLQQPQS